MSSSCQKCVKVLRDLISGLHENNINNNIQDGPTQNRSFSTSIVTTTNDNDNSTQTKKESPPLTLLKAIAGAAAAAQQQQQQQQQQNGENKNNLHIEEIQDGVRLTIPVETTLPNLLRRWTKLPKPIHYDDDEEGDSIGLLQPLFHAMATSANGPLDDENDNALSGLKRSSAATQEQNHPSSDGNDDNNNSNKNQKKMQPLADPLTIELKCRKCASTGPEGGARAFLMGPQPLSVVLCHNRIASNQQEVEEILTHELVHLFDVQTLQLDLQDCENLAYSEVRAAKAAECRDSWKQLQPYCVKQKAISATNNLFPKDGRTCINRVFATAFADNRPFDGAAAAARKKRKSAATGFATTTTTSHASKDIDGSNSSS